MHILNLLICNWLFEKYERLIHQISAFDVRITRTCRNVTIFNTITLSPKLMLVKICSFLNTKPIGVSIALINPPKHATDNNVNINLLVSLVLKFVQYMILAKRSTPIIAIV